MMKTRRMFSKDIVESNAFLEMPVSTQNLYFHLGINADDEGFVGNSHIVMASIKASDDDLKLLAAKGFVIQLPNGILIIKHWFINNYIRSKRIIPTNYVEERKLLFIKSNLAYTLNGNEGIPLPDSYKNFESIQDYLDASSYQKKGCTPSVRQVYASRVNELSELNGRNTYPLSVNNNNTEKTTEESTNNPGYDSWDKDIAKTMEIAKEMWGDK